MEFPELGQNCSIDTCKQLDFLPVKCDACLKIFCKDHFAYDLHNCPDAYKKDNQIPICPLCNAPITQKKGQTADEVVGRHIDNDCQSDTAIHKRKVYSNRCSKKGCKTKELIPFNCKSCHKNYCIKHRLETDHECRGFENSGRAVSSSAAAAVRRSQASTSGASSQSQPQKTNLSSLGKALDRERQERQSNQPQPRNLRAMQSGMTEQEAMERAIAMSLSPEQSSSSKSSEQIEQEEADLALARALQQSEQEMRNPRPTSQVNQREKSCVLS